MILIARLPIVKVRGQLFSEAFNTSLAEVASYSFEFPDTLDYLIADN